MLLNQTAISSGQNFNVTQQLVNNLTINWSVLPAGVQTALLNEKSGGILFNLTFAQWGWSQVGDTFATTTLISLFSPLIQDLPQIIASLASLNFNTVMNTTLLPQVAPNKPDRRHSGSSEKSNEVFSFGRRMFFRGGDHHRGGKNQGGQNKGGWHGHHHGSHSNEDSNNRQPSAFDVIQKAKDQACNVVVQNAVGNGLNKNFYF